MSPMRAPGPTRLTLPDDSVEMTPVSLDLRLGAQREIELSTAKSGRTQMPVIAVAAGPVIQTTGSR